jgi:signal transduction histidine kinase
VVPGALDVEITYDGQVDAAAANGATGLRGMAERAEALGGRLEVRPRADGGWRVHAVFPLGSDRR